MTDDRFAGFRSMFELYERAYQVAEAIKGRVIVGTRGFVGLDDYIAICAAERDLSGAAAAPSLLMARHGRANGPTAFLVDGVVYLSDPICQHGIRRIPAINIP